MGRRQARVSLSGEATVSEQGPPHVFPWSVVFCRWLGTFRGLAKLLPYSLEESVQARVYSYTSPLAYGVLRIERNKDQ